MQEDEEDSPADADNEFEEVEDTEDTESGRANGRELFEAMRANPPYTPYTSPTRAIRQFCLQCCKEHVTEVSACPADGVHSTFCVLWPFRFGKSPFRQKREVTDEQREQARVRFAKIRSKS